MKNTFKILVNLNRAIRRLAKVPLLIITLVTVIGFSMIACSNGSIGGGNVTYDVDWQENARCIRDS